jgi:hypothetical protein
MVEFTEGHTTQLNRGEYSRYSLRHCSQCCHVSTTSSGVSRTAPFGDIRLHFVLAGEVGGICRGIVRDCIHEEIASGIDDKKYDGEEQRDRDTCLNQGCPLAAQQSLRKPKDPE